MGADNGECAATPLLRQAKRPSLGPLAFAALAAWLAAMGAEGLSWLVYVDEAVGSAEKLILAGLAVPAVGLGTLTIYLTRRCRHLPVAFVAILPALVAAGCVFACSMLYWHSWERGVALLQEAVGDGVAIEAVLCSDPAERDYGTVSEACAVVGGEQVTFRLLWPQEGQTLSAGHTVRVCGSIKVPGNDESGRWNHRQGFAGTMNAAAAEDVGCAQGPRGWVAGLRDSAMDSIAEVGGDAAGLLAGIVVGNRTLYAGSELEQDFRTTGLAHLMAVSGTHLAVVTMLASWLLSRLRLKRWKQSALLAFVLGAYVALTCFAPSAMRAYVMCLAVLTASCVSRRGHAPTALFACVLLFLATAPQLAFSLGFKLSVLCMVGLLALSPLIGIWLRAVLPSRLGGLADGIAATFAANLATLPVTVSLFCQLPLISPLSTLLVSPLVTLALGMGIPGVLLAQLCAPLGFLMLRLAGYVARLTCALVHFLADLPMACAPLDASASFVGAVFFLLGAALWVFWPSPLEELDHALGRRAAARRTILVCGFAALPLVVALLTGLSGVAGSANLVAPGSVASDAQAVMLDVGQGDAMLVRDGDAAVLVDTGEDPTVLLKALARHGVTRLDAVLISHKDIDHAGALSGLAGVVQVGHVYIHKDLVQAECCAQLRSSASWALSGREVEGVAPGDVVTVGRFSLSLLSPQNGGESENEDSLIWLLEFGEKGGRVLAKGLLTGDGEQAEVAAVFEDVGDIDFLKVGHHGSRDAVNDEEMRVLKPELALIGVGAGNDYGHPTEQTLGVLERGGSKVLRTDLHGDITLGFSSESIAVSTQKGG